MDVYLYSGKDGIIRECEDSLRRLQTEYIDLYQVHRPDPSTPIEETMLALEELKKQGKILEAGVSNYTLEQLQLAKSFFPVVSNQMPYSMLEREIENEMLPWCIENGIGILVYSPLQRGVLSGKYRGKINWHHDDHRKDTKWFSEENRTRINAFLDTITPIADKYEVSLAQLIINWTSMVQGISCVLIGARNSDQVLHNIRSLEFSIEDSEFRQIQSFLDELELV
jgi:aryl-alcohol dehydrogenase-like predicted oxidoreductase